MSLWSVALAFEVLACFVLLVGFVEFCALAFFLVVEAWDVLLVVALALGLDSTLLDSFGFALDFTFCVFSSLAMWVFYYMCREYTRWGAGYTILISIVNIIVRHDSGC